MRSAATSGSALGARQLPSPLVGQVLAPREDSARANERVYSPSAGDAHHRGPSAPWHPSRESVVNQSVDDSQPSAVRQKGGARAAGGAGAWIVPVSPVPTA